MTAAVCDQQLTVFGAVVYHSYGAHLFTAQRPPRISEYAVEKRTEQNFTVRSGSRDDVGYIAHAGQTKSYIKGVVTPPS